MESFRVFVERQRADPIAAKFLSVACSAIRLRALRFSPLLPIAITPHHHEKIRFRARHLRHVALGHSRHSHHPAVSGSPPKSGHSANARVCTRPANLEYSRLADESRWP